MLFYTSTATFSILVNNTQRFHTLHLNCYFLFLNMHYSNASSLSSTKESYLELAFLWISKFTSTVQTIKKTIHFTLSVRFISAVWNIRKCFTPPTLLLSLSAYCVPTDTFNKTIYSSGKHFTLPNQIFPVSCNKLLGHFYSSSIQYYSLRLSGIQTVFTKFKLFRGQFCFLSFWSR